MINPEVASYIQKAREKNLPESQMRADLIKNGWSPAEIEEALTGNQTDAALTNDLLPPTKPGHTVSHGMWDAFEHILLFISLYFLATSVALILHLFVDRWVPGIVTESNSYYQSDAVNKLQTLFLRGYLAALIVSLPLFLFFFLDITKRTTNDVTMRNLRSRKILIYITLIITFLIMLGHVTFIVFALLNGEVTFNLMLHLLVTFFVNGLIFTYYLFQVKQDRRKHA